MSLENRFSPNFILEGIVVCFVGSLVDAQEGSGSHLLFSFVVNGCFVIGFNVPN